MKRFIFLIGALLALGTVPAYSAFGILIEAESFDCPGGWSMDQQFMDQMGSAYLIAHGLGIKVQDAYTSVNIPESGEYRVYVRTFNWVSPWTDKPGPGAFKLAFDDKPMKTVLGTQGRCWMWQYAGSVKLNAGTVRLSLQDQSGFDGRCDAVFLTTGSDLPPEGTNELDAFRRSLGTLSPAPEDGGEYDLVVAGGGIGGMCAAVTAARLGLKVALVHDRPILGGNNSSEIRVHLGGRTEAYPYPALGRMIREFGHSTKGNARPAEYYEDGKKMDFVTAEKNITLLLSTRVVAVNMANDHKIASLVAREICTGREMLLHAPLFCDCTGDGNIGFMAGADWMMGREGRNDYGESLAPETGDSMTMGASIQWYSTAAGKRTRFPEFDYGVRFTEESCEKVKMGEWTWEIGMNRDQINEAERIRDYGLMVVYSNWSYLKNHSSLKKQYDSLQLGWVAYVAGKRETRRLMGDYVLSQEDVDKNVFHEDATFTTTWHFDLHFPDPANSKYFPGEEFKAQTKQNSIYPYAVPFRCLYSRNVDNLMMAGRDISVTHVALGSVRLMRTIGMMGEVAGMAASVCRAHDVLPREVYWHHMTELRELMEKGAARTDIELPDNQRFNLSPELSAPIYSGGRK